LTFFEQLVPLLLELAAKSKDEVVVEYSSAVLSNSATLYSGRSDIITRNGPAILVSLASRSDPDIQRNAIETIWRLLQDVDNIPTFTEAENLQPIISLLDSEYPAIQVIAMAIVCRVSEAIYEHPKLESHDLIKNMGAVRAAI
jgi:hypothetical protein